MSLEDKITDKSAMIGIIGLGYVGLPLAVRFAKKGFRVYGLDKRESVIRDIKAGKSYTPDVSDEDIRRLYNDEEKLIPLLVQKNEGDNNTLFSKLSTLDVAIICVSTPVYKDSTPNLESITEAVNLICNLDKRKRLIILESTIPPLTTETTVCPKLEKRFGTINEDFYLVYSPERIVPGDRRPERQFEEITKLLGGFGQKSTDIGKRLYMEIIDEDKIYSVSSPRIAEMAKLVENTYRAVNISLMFEVAQLCPKLGINVWEVIKACKTKDFGFKTFYPGPGVGGHCIPSDPLYLHWKAKDVGFRTRLIPTADSINKSMPSNVIGMITDGLNKKKACINGSKILIIGVAYKEDINDYRESPALEVIHQLISRRAEVKYVDPRIDNLPDFNEVQCVSMQELTTDSIKDFDCIVILTNHEEFSLAFYQELLENGNLIVDTRNALEDIQEDLKKRHEEKIIVLGATM